MPKLPEIGSLLYLSNILRTKLGMNYLHAEKHQNLLQADAIT